jgi:F420 biosynthesis protein FbiB-like protein
MTPTDLHAFLRSRQSIRHFTPKAIPQDVLERVLATATYAPSAHNRQPWRFVVLTATTDKEMLAARMGAEFHRDLLADGIVPEKAAKTVARSSERIQRAGAVVLLCMTLEDMDAYPDPKRQTFEHLMAAQSVALAGGTLLLAAHAEGLGGVWVCAPLFAQRAVRDALNLPAHWEVHGMLLLGYPAKVGKPRSRKPLNEVVLYAHA